MQGTGTSHKINAKVMNLKVSWKRGRAKRKVRGDVNGLNIRRMNIKNKSLKDERIVCKDPEQVK